MNGHISQVALFCALSSLLGGCVEHADASAPDAGVGKSERRKKVADPKAGATELSGMVGGVGVEAYPECMPASSAVSRTRKPQTGVVAESAGSSTMSKELPECPAFIWTYVGAGHSAHPVGDVTAPLSVPASRKQRKREPHACCYLIPPAPGSPNG